MNSSASPGRLAAAAPRAGTERQTAAPDSIGPYTPTALLYAGPWSRVYRARPVSSIRSDAPFALKLPIAGARDKVAAANMLRREIRVMQSVTQSNLVALLDYRLDDQAEYLLTPHLEGATLRNVFDAGWRSPLSHALWIARQVAQALAALHEAGWRHGDVKPENILVAPSGHATLLDLGLAERLDENNERAHRQAITGTLTHTAPECLKSDSRVDHRSDIYSLGVVLFQLVAGHPPFAAPNAASLREAHLRALPPELKLRGSVVASDVRHLVRQMLAKDPLRRPQSAGELATRLMRLEVATLHERVAA